MMKVTVWQAWASNNSGSYTLVGRFPSDELAAEVAAELAAVCDAHSKWCEEHRWDESGSPLDELAARVGLTSRGEGEWTDSDPPAVVAVGHQVVVWVERTNGMPAVMGELIYKRGGRVETEIDHAHEPVVSEIAIWLPKLETSEEQEALVVKVRDEILADAAVRAALDDEATDQSQLESRVGTHWLHPALTIGALFEDLPAGCAAVAAIARRHGCGHELHVLETREPDAPLDYLKKPRPDIP